MASVKISELPVATTPLSGTEIVPLTQAGVTKQATVADVVYTVAYQNKTNPTIPGWGVSFNAPTAPGYSNGSSQTYTLTGASTYAVNGALLNVIVDATYDKDIIGNVTSNPVAVGANIEMQVLKPNAGNDFWANVGLLDVQVNGTGGQATSGIVRGNWTGTALIAGLRSQAENYSGRAAYGLIVGSSQTEGTGSPFDNSYGYGVLVHSAKAYGVAVGGLSGALNANVPDYPFAFINADGTKTLWSIRNGGDNANQFINGAITINSSTSFPLLQLENDIAASDAKNWQQIAEADGSWSLRTLNDAENAANSVIRITRTGITANSCTVSAPFEVSTTAGGILFPRMTTAQRDAISSPANGLVLYNTTTDKLQVRAAGAWVDLH